MKSLKYRIRNFFGFSRAQTNGFVGLLFIVTIVLFSQPVYHWWVSGKPIDFLKEKVALDSLAELWELRVEATGQIPAVDESAISFFEFNPNTASEEELSALGFSVGMAKRLVNYRNKGGQFRIKSDLKKLYGMDSAFYRNLSPFIQLPESIVYPERERVSFEPKKFVHFNLNEADTAQLQQLYGIGSVLSKRIIKYRESLGGFISTNQLHEVFGLDTTVVNRVKQASFLPDSNTPRKININKAAEKELSAHPYVSGKVASAIVTYRFQHGNFQSVDDLQKIHIIDKTVLARIYPYLTAE